MAQSTSSIITKLTELMKDWISMLTGKPRSSLASVQQPVTPDPAKSEIDPEDPVYRDMAKAKEASQKVLNAVEEKLKPIIGKEKTISTDLVSTFGAKAKLLSGNSIVKKAALGIVVLILIIFAGLWITKLIQTTQNGKAKNEAALSATPTSAEFVSTQPSVYAIDKTVLEIEQKLIILDKQIETTNIREGTLNPPVLDFSVSF